MIVKNESAIIERCLASVAPIISYYVICDTGSTDDTRELIRSFFEQRNIPGELHNTSFENFGAARNVALAFARKSEGLFDYLLLVDADMEMEVFDEVALQQLDAPAYLARQYGGLSYWNIRILHRDVAAVYEGATHEYLSVEAMPSRLEHIVFQDHACGASRPEKLERDQQLLEQALALNPNDVRSMFYLAQTYHEACIYTKAQMLYKKRVEAGGWEEEVWYAILMHARCCLALDDFVGFVDGCLSAYEFRPSRAEPLADLASFYRERGQYETAMLWVEAGKRIPYPIDDVLFIDDRVYQYAFLEESSIAGFYCKTIDRRRSAYEAVLELQLSRDVPIGVRSVARRNGMFYAPRAAELFGDLSTTHINLPMPEPFIAMNPSVLLEGKDLIAVVRGVNYRLDDPERSCQHLSEVRSCNYLTRLAHDGAIIRAQEIVTTERTPIAVPGAVLGFEDMRLFRWRDKLHATATCRDRNHAMRCEIVLLELDADARIVDLQVLQGYRDSIHEKNWMPVVDNDDLLLVYLCDPTIILRYDSDQRAVKLVAEHQPALALDHLRGGSQLVKFNDGWLCLTHEVTEIETSQRRYMHRFLHFDCDLHIAAITEPFCFSVEPVEFAAGLAYDHVDDKLIASYGVQDCRAELAIIDAAAVRQALEKVPTN